MTEGLLLVGASGLAREVLAAGVTGVSGILDDNQDLHGSEIAGVPVIGDVASADRRSEQLLVCIGASGNRRKVVHRLKASGVGTERFATFVARSAHVGHNSRIGVGSILLDGVVVTADADIGRHVVVMPHCTITHDDRLCDFSFLAAGVALGGWVTIGEAAFVGMNASIRQRITVGEAATVGMGAVVLEDVPQGQVWAGVPARRLQP